MSDKNMDFKTLSERYKKEMMSAYENYRPTVRTYGNNKAEVESLPNSEQFSQNLQPQQTLPDSERFPQGVQQQQIVPEENVILPMKPDDSEEDGNGEDTSENVEVAPQDNVNAGRYDNLGYIKVVVSVAAEAVPIPGAEVTVSRGEGDTRLYFEKFKTDLSGGTPVISVPAPDKENSLEPDSSGTVFYEYRIEVFVEGYERAIIDKVPVFEGVLSLQPISLRPVSTVTNGND